MGDKGFPSNEVPYKRVYHHHQHHGVPLRRLHEERRRITTVPAIKTTVETRGASEKGFLPPNLNNTSHPSIRQ